MSTSGTTTTIDHKAFFIGGSWRPADGTDHFDVIPPRSERRVGRVPAASEADIDAALAAARRAFDEGEWPRLTPAQRAHHLTRLADGIERRRTELAEPINDAVRIANDSELGLDGSVFTADAADTAHGFEAARRVLTRTFSVNTFAADLGWPFGGFKKSGLGREHDPGAVEEFLLTKTVSTDPGAGLTAEVTQGVPLGTGPGTHGPVK
ncbi:aldehyde dehydrogenase family protein [Streptomyces sp. NPDC058441]|uniref:aldehyde dehydrogenase family protein n=1 Tax=Streptomyces sp. NPDC058441 TaxID=3346502 RepID=UPI003667E7F3